jgi:hypothetical protein
MYLCLYSVFVLSCVQAVALRLANPTSKESYRLCKRSWNCNSGQGPTKDCRAIDRKMLIGSVVITEYYVRFRIECLHLEDICE